jgi:hypothetical protein
MCRRFAPLGSPPANSPRHCPIPALAERLDLQQGEAGEHDPELRDLQNVQGLLLRGVQSRLPGLISANHELDSKGENGKSKIETGTSKRETPQLCRLSIFEFRVSFFM